MSLENKTIANSYKDLLQVDASNNGIQTTTKSIKDGAGISTCLSVSDDRLIIRPQNDDSTAVLDVRNSGNTNILAVDTNNSKVTAGTTGTALNTQMQHFGLSSASALPSSTNWTGIPSSGQSTQTRMEMGSGSTPNTSFTVTLTGDDLVGHIFYVPINITIDSCFVWAGGDASSGDTIQFSVMSYDINNTNSSNGGDLGNGVENCVSPSTIATAGYEQSYYQELTISNADVDAGKAIIAFIKSDGTNSDYSVNMTLTYHFR